MLLKSFQRASNAIVKSALRSLILFSYRCLFTWLPYESLLFFQMRKLLVDLVWGLDCPCPQQQWKIKDHLITSLGIVCLSPIILLVINRRGWYTIIKSTVLVLYQSINSLFVSPYTLVHLLFCPTLKILCSSPKSDMWKTFQGLLISWWLVSDLSFVLKIFPCPFSLSSLHFQIFGIQFRSNSEVLKRKRRTPVLYVMGKASLWSFLLVSTLFKEHCVFWKDRHLL